MASQASSSATTRQVRVELRNALFATALPNAVMTAVFFGLGLRITRELHDEWAWAALGSGLICAVLKLAVIAAYKRRSTTSMSLLHAPDHWADVFALLSLGLASSLGILGARAFASDTVPMQMLATGLLFGYCSGLVAHTSIRPRLAAACLTISTIPVAASAALREDSAHHLLAGSLICFMLAAFQSIRHMYHATRQQIIDRQAMAALARVDPLTHLPNRLALEEAFSSRIGREQGFALHCIDLDAFKPVNDHYGHPTGDALLQAVADRVRSALRAQDTVARVGGDEFVIIQSGVRDQADATMFARKLVNCITAPYEINRNRIEIGVSLGFVTATPTEHDLHDLVALADAALYQAKQNGGGIGVAETKAG